MIRISKTNNYKQRTYPRITAKKYLPSSHAVSEQPLKITHARTCKRTSILSLRTSISSLSKKITEEIRLVLTRTKYISASVFKSKNFTDMLEHISLSVKRTQTTASPQTYLPQQIINVEARFYEGKSRTKMPQLVEKIDPTDYKQVDRHVSSPVWRSL